MGKTKENMLMALAVVSVALLYVAIFFGEPKDPNESEMREAASKLMVYADRYSEKNTNMTSKGAELVSLMGYRSFAVLDYKDKPTYVIVVTGDTYKSYTRNKEGGIDIANCKIAGGGCTYEFSLFKQK